MDEKAWFEQRERLYQRVFDSDPLPAETKARLMADAEYMAARILDLPARPPAHWSAERIAAWAETLATPEARRAALEAMLAGFRRVNVLADALPPDE